MLFRLKYFFPFSENAMMYQISFSVFHFHSRLCSRVAAVWWIWVFSRWEHFTYVAWGTRFLPTKLWRTGVHTDWRREGFLDRHCVYSNINPYIKNTCADLKTSLACDDVFKRLKVRINLLQWKYIGFVIQDCLCARLNRFGCNPKWLYTNLRKGMKQQ